MSSVSVVAEGATAKLKSRAPSELFAAVTCCFVGTVRAAFVCLDGVESSLSRSGTSRSRSSRSCTSAEKAGKGDEEAAVVALVCATEGVCFCVCGLLPFCWDTCWAYPSRSKLARSLRTSLRSSNPSILPPSVSFLCSSLLGLVAFGCVLFPFLLAQHKKCVPTFTSSLHTLALSFDHQPCIWACLIADRR